MFIYRKETLGDYWSAGGWTQGIIIHYATLSCLNVKHWNITCNDKHGSSLEWTLIWDVTSHTSQSSNLCETGTHNPITWHRHQTSQFDLSFSFWPAWFTDRWPAMMNAFAYTTDTEVKVSSSLFSIEWGAVSKYPLNCCFIIIQCYLRCKRYKEEGFEGWLTNSPTISMIHLFRYNLKAEIQ